MDDVYDIELVGSYHHKISQLKLNLQIPIIGSFNTGCEIVF